MTKNKKIPKTRLFVVVDRDSTFIGYFDTMDDIFTYLEKNSADVEDITVLECIKAYTLYYPEEPDPEIIELPLDEVV